MDDALGTRTKFEAVVSATGKNMGRGTARRKLIDGSDGLWRNIARRIAVERRNALGRRTVPE